MSGNPSKGLPDMGDTMKEIGVTVSQIEDLLKNIDTGTSSDDITDETFWNHIIGPSSDVSKSGLHPKISPGTRLQIDRSVAGQILNMESAVLSYLQGAFDCLKDDVIIRGSHGKMMEVGQMADLDVSVYLTGFLKGTWKAQYDENGETVTVLLDEMEQTPSKLVEELIVRLNSVLIKRFKIHRSGKIITGEYSSKMGKIVKVDLVPTLCIDDVHYIRAESAEKWVEYDYDDEDEDVQSLPQNWRTAVVAAKFIKKMLYWGTKSCYFQFLAKKLLESSEIELVSTTDAALCLLLEKTKDGTAVSTYGKSDLRPGKTPYIDEILSAKHNTRMKTTCSILIDKFGNGDENRRKYVMGGILKRFQALTKSLSDEHSVESYLHGQPERNIPYDILFLFRCYTAAVGPEKNAAVVAEEAPSATSTTTPGMMTSTEAAVKAVEAARIALQQLGAAAEATPTAESKTKAKKAAIKAAKNAIEAAGAAMTALQLMDEIEPDFEMTDDDGGRG